MHDVSEMLSRAKQEALKLEITLDFDSCLKQLEHFGPEDAETKEGFKMVYDEFMQLLNWFT